MVRNMNKSYNKMEIWEEYTAKMTVDSIVDSVQHPAIFQIELSEYLNNILGGKGKVIEVGCEAGVTSFLLDADERCFFDLDSGIIEKSKKAHDILFKDVNSDSYVVGNMFDMPFEDGYFDLTFNAGVLEHFSSDEVVEALKEMRRITKPGGKVVVAIPNHHCAVYRTAYLLCIFLDFLHIRKFPWPRANKYYDLRREMERAEGLCFESRITMSKESIWQWWGRKCLFPVRFFFKTIDKFKPFEGYLTVITMTKE